MAGIAEQSETVHLTTLSNARAASEASQRAERAKMREAHKTQFNNNVNQHSNLEFTITFKPQLHNNLSNMALRGIVKGTLVSILKGSRFNNYVKLLYEISPSGMYHYHGVISDFTREQIMILRKQFNKYIGRTEIKQITHWENYLDYVTKRYTEEEFKYYGGYIHEENDITLKRVYNDKSKIKEQTQKGQKHKAVVRNHHDYEGPENAFVRVGDRVLSKGQLQNERDYLKSLFYLESIEK